MLMLLATLSPANVDAAGGCGGDTARLPPPYVSLDLGVFGVPNRKESPFVRRGILSGIVIDVGVNDGKDFTLPAVQNGYRVLSFEPLQKRAAEVLFKAGNMVPRNKTTNAKQVQQIPVEPGALLSATQHALTDENLGNAGPGLVLFNAAVSNVPSRVPIFEPTNSGGMSPMATLSSHNMPFGPGRKKKADAEQTAIVATLPLDNVVRHGGYGAGPRVGLLKLDSQGHELHILRGAPRLLSEPGTPEFMQLEFVPRLISNMNRAQSDGQQARQAPLRLLELLRQSGRFCFHDMYSPLNTSTAAGGSLPFAQFVAAHRHGSEAAETAGCGMLGCHSELFCVQLCVGDNVHNKLVRLFKALSLERTTTRPQFKQLVASLQARLDERLAS